MAPLGAEYQYSVNGGAFQASPLFLLGSGSYTITVQNAQGCTSVSAPYVINPAPAAPAVATAIVTDPTCTSSGNITIMAPLGTEYQYSVNGGAFQVSPLFSLGSGSYTITVQNAQGCTSVSTPYIINPAPVAPAVATAITVDPTCTSSGSLTITAPLGTEYQYSVNGGAFQVSPIFSLGSGSYTITVQNAQGCTSVSAPYVINVGQTGQPEVSGIQGCQPTINGNNYILEAQALNNSFNMAEVRFEWKLQGQQAILGDDATFNVTAYSMGNNNSMEDFPLNFELTVITPAGCTGQYLFTVDGIFCDIPRGISPNGDNKNDRFDLTGLNVRHIEIFNRYGMQVYKKANYTNDWHGQSNGGDDLPTGTYYYVINLGNNTKTGWVYINRNN
jgi:gliding motility-associated-like protein